MISPFSSGSQYMDWKESNCSAGCAKAYDESAQEWRCDIERAIDEAYMETGEIDEAIADRMGHDDGRYVWPCKEHDPPWKERPKP